MLINHPEFREMRGNLLSLPNGYTGFPPGCSTARSAPLGSSFSTDLLPGPGLWPVAIRSPFGCSSRESTHFEGSAGRKDRSKLPSVLLAYSASRLNDGRPSRQVVRGRRGWLNSDTHLAVPDSQHSSIRPSSTPALPAGWNSLSSKRSSFVNLPAAKTKSR